MSKVGKWNVGTLHVHLLRLMEERDLRNEQRFQATNTAITAALTAADRAVGKAEAATEKRFDSMNEFRGAMNDQQKLFMPRHEVDSAIGAINKRLDLYEKSGTLAAGKSTGLRDGWAVAIGVVGVFGLVASVVVAFVK